MKGRQSFCCRGGRFTEQEQTLSKCCARSVAIPMQLSSHIFRPPPGQRVTLAQKDIVGPHMFARVSLQISSRQRKGRNLPGRPSCSYRRAEQHLKVSEVTGFLW